MSTKFKQKAIKFWKEMRVPYGYVMWLTPLVLAICYPLGIVKPLKFYDYIVIAFLHFLGFYLINKHHWSVE